MAERRLGLYSEQFVPDLHEEMGRTVRAAGARVEGWFYCPHHPRAVTDALRAEWAPSSRIAIRTCQRWRKPALSTNPSR